MATPRTAVTRLDLSFSYQEISLASVMRKFIGLRVLPALGVDEVDTGRAARQRLKPQRPAPGIQVQATRPLDIVLQPVEQRLAHCVRRRPDPAVRRLEPASPPLPANDAQAARLHFSPPTMTVCMPSMFSVDCIALVICSRVTALMRSI